MSNITEYYTVYKLWEFHEEFDYRNDDDCTLNFEKNMEEFEDIVNEYLEEGWQPLGAPTFSTGWLSRSRQGVAIQALIREKNVEPAVVVDVNPTVIIAEQIKPLRCSLRITGGLASSDSDSE
jgi:hypothetical protein